MTLDQLRYFQAVCKYDGVSRAAEQLNISQPSVSSAISKLEDEFNTVLFTRQNKKLILTKEGGVLLNLADDLLFAADQAKKTMENISDHKALNLGLSPMLSSLILPILYNSFLFQHPEIKINPVEGNSTELEQMLNENIIDMAFFAHGRHGLKKDHLDSVLFTKTYNVCVVHKDNPLAKKSTIRIPDLENEVLVLHTKSFQSAAVRSRFRRSGIKPNVLFETGHVSTIQNAVANKLASSFMYDFLIKHVPDLVGIPVDPKMPTRISLAWRKGQQLSGNMNALIDFVTDYAKNNG